MGRIYGVVPGVVKGVEDPEKRGRLEVRFPWLSDEDKAHASWARVATMMSGPDRGSWFMPEPDDEVLVAFEHGDPQEPYVIGYLWNGQDKPPITGSDPFTKVRRLKTVSGHQMDFDDRDNKEKVVVTTHGEHLLEMIDAPPTEKGIKVTSKGGHVAHLDDTALGKGITVTTKAGHEIHMDDLAASQAVKVTTAGSHVVELTDKPTPKIAVKFKGADAPAITMEQQSMKMAFSSDNYIEMTPTGMKLQFSSSSYIEITAASITIKGTLVDINP